MNIYYSKEAPKPVGAYPHARQVGNLLYLSGVGPRDKDSAEIPGVELDEKGRILNYDIEVQCHSVFKNVEVMLRSANLELKDLVDITVFLTNIKDDFKTFNGIYEAYFGEILPTRTTVQVSALPTPIAIELKCIAAFPHD